MSAPVMIQDILITATITILILITALISLGQPIVRIPIVRPRAPPGLPPRW